MARVFVPTMLQATTGGVKEIEVAARNVRQVIEQLDEQFPGIANRLMEDGEIRSNLAVAVDGEQVPAVVLSVGNPQCIVLVDSFADAERRFEHLGPRLATHERFPAGTNVELVAVERPDRLRMLIWERGVGPTSASGTGACAAAVAAAAFGGAARTVDVISPGGSQRVEWAPDGIRLTGWAEIVCRGTWLGRQGDLT